MTVIVWDGETLAADRQSSHQNLRRSVTKISKHGDLLIACSGTYTAAQAVKAWLVSGAEVEDFPFARVDEHTAVIAINKEGQILRFEDSPFPVVLNDKIIAEGTGRDFALGAMAMGADAAKAVEIACVYDIYSGGGIDRLKFD